MGIGKKAATHKGKKIIENVTEDIPIVGDLVDDTVKSGPMDRTKDSLDNTKDKFDRDKGKLGRDKDDKGILGRKK